MKQRSFGQGRGRSARRGDVVIILMVVMALLLAVMTVVSIIGTVAFLNGQNGNGGAATPDMTAVDQADESADEALTTARSSMDEVESAYERAVAAKMALQEGGQDRYDTQVERQGLEEQLASLPAGENTTEIEGRLEETLASENTALSDEDAAFIAYEAAVEDLRSALAEAGARIDAAEAAAQTYEDEVIRAQREAGSAGNDGSDPAAAGSDPAPAPAPVDGGGEQLAEVDALRARWSELSALASSEFPPGAELVPEKIGRSRDSRENPELDTTVYLVVAAITRAEDGPYAGQWVFQGEEEDGFAILSYDEETETRSARQVASSTLEAIRDRYPENRVVLIELTNQPERPRPEAGLPVAALDERIDVDALAGSTEADAAGGDAAEADSTEADSTESNSTES